MNITPFNPPQIKLMGPPSDAFPIFSVCRADLPKTPLLR